MKYPRPTYEPDRENQDKTRTVTFVLSPVIGFGYTKTIIKLDENPLTTLHIVILPFFAILIYRHNLEK